MERHRIDCYRRVLFGIAILLGACGSVYSSESNTYWRVLEQESYLYDYPYRIGLLNPLNGADTARAWSQTKSIFVYGFGVLGILFALPEDNTGWEKDPAIFKKWVDNVTAGPEWDRNNWAYNYLGHTYFGGVYYQVARKSGYRQWDSFVYSFLMSTFYWEFGIEALAEVPSVQDLAFTPLAGWIYGEWAYQTERNIRANANEVLGSRTLGNISLALLDPVDSFGSAINHIAGREWIKAGYGYVTYAPASANDRSGNVLYLHLRVPLGAAGPESKPANNPRAPTVDPVDTGIVGVGVGPAYVVPDDAWDVESGLATKVTMGLYFTPRTSLRMAYVQGSLEQESISEGIVYESYSLDAQYYLNADKRIRPYLSAGLGEQIWDKDEDQQTFQWNGGLGLHSRLTRKLALQLDWLNYYSPSKDTLDRQFSAGLLYRFGQGEHDNW